MNYLTCLFVVHVDEARVHEEVGIRPRAVADEYLPALLEVPQCVALAAIRRRVEVRRDLRESETLIADVRAHGASLSRAR